MFWVYKVQVCGCRFIIQVCGYRFRLRVKGSGFDGCDSRYNVQGMRIRVKGKGLMG